LSDRETPSVATARAFQANLNGVKSTLNFFVPTVCLLCCIPVALAWKHSPSRVGTVDDANFYQLIASSLIQFLGLATLLWPTLFYSRFSGYTLLWIWALAVFSGTCTLLSIPFYVLLPVAWSMVVAFGGMIAQALIILQVIETI
jgi:hypothetical protein